MTADDTAAAAALLAPADASRTHSVAPIRVGSLCSGYGGLDMGVQLVYPQSRVVWHVEYDPQPSKILDHHWPDVPNHGDVKHTDWTAVEPIEVLTAGYPCQPFSHAGLRKGADDPRHLWPGVARAISVLRPRLAVLENVRGHVSLGLDAVLGDLAELGYDARWGVVRASDAGAPHSRARIFILAADTRLTRAGRDTGAVLGAQEPGRLPADGGGPSGVHHTPPTDARSERHGRGEDAGSLGRVDGATEGVARERQRSWPEPLDRGPAAATDAGGIGRHGRQGVGGEGRQAPLRGQARDHVGDLGGVETSAADAPSHGRDEGRTESARFVGGSDAAERGDTNWGDYGPAITRWERIIGRAAPRPTEPAQRGERLSPRFVEWMMGLPAGHVTDVPGLARNAQLKALGNGVVPQQAALAVRTLAVAA